MKRAAVVLAAGILLVLSGVALASIPDAQGVIHGCYKTNNPNRGQVIVIDTGAGQTCPSGYTALNWNQTGPQGPAGPPGLSGAQVLSTSLHTDSGLTTKTTVCPDGQFAISGGHRYAPDGSPTDWNVSVRRSEPQNISAGLGQWWTVEVAADVAGTLTTYAYCLTRP